MQECEIEFEVLSVSEVNKFLSQIRPEPIMPITEIM